MLTMRESDAGGLLYPSPAANLVGRQQRGVGFLSKAKRVFALSMILMCWFSVCSAASAFRVGDQGTEVAEIQGQLVRLGYDVSADGDYGPATAEAVKAFQTTKGMDADGQVGSTTYTALLGKSMPAVAHSTNYINRTVISESMQYLGVPYVFGGTSPSGFDCSGYVQYVFAHAGLSLPRTADVQFECGSPVSSRDLVPGDLVFFSTYAPGASHVGIYLGDRQFINASSSHGVSVASLDSSYWGACYIGARRVL